jgi:DNA-binding transcriptional ArsR family regulator
LKKFEARKNGTSRRGLVLSPQTIAVSAAHLSIIEAISMTKKSVKSKASAAQRGGWFRLYHDLIDSAKIQTLPDRTFKFWINVLAATDRKRAGVIPSVSELDYRLRLPQGTAEALLIELIDAKLVDQAVEDGTRVLRPHDWDEWQPNSGLSTQRVRKFRAKETDETARNGFRNVSETAETCLSASSPVRREEGAIQEKNLVTGVIVDPVHSLADPAGHQAIEGTYGRDATPAKVVTLASRRVS